MERKDEMRILLDTNILFSVALYPNSVPQRAFEKAVTLPNVGIVSYQSLEELTSVFHKKLPDKLPYLEHFLVTYLCGVELVSTPNKYIDAEDNIRDPDDRTIYRAAIKAKADIILTGDKDLLESGITSPQIMTAREFLNLNNL